MVSFCLNTENIVNNSTQDVIDKLTIEYNMTQEDIDIYAQYNALQGIFYKLYLMQDIQNKLPQIVKNAPYRPFLTATKEQQQIYLKYRDIFFSFNEIIISQNLII